MATKILIAAGGTGGHIFPGIAVARELKRRDATSDVVFVGTAHGLETKIVPREGFELELIDISGLKRVGLIAMLKTLLVTLPKSFVQSWRLISRRKPQLVIGVGGYASGPIVLLAALRGIPTLVIEPNALPGFTNRVLARVARAAAVSFAEAAPYFRGKAMVTGNPVRTEFFKLSELQPEQRRAMNERHILVVGGSQGASAINMAMVAALPLVYSMLEARGSRLVVTCTHQTGERDHASVRAAYEKLGLGHRASTVVFIDRMAHELARADLLISRAGATTIAELTAAGKPAILIPLPTAADDHQRKNALALERAGAARCLPQPEMTPESLAEEILKLIEDESKLDRMSQAGRKLAHVDAAEKIVDLAYQLFGGSQVRITRSHEAMRVVSGDSHRPS
jgi:UDP-N-acetylglucosamine--N-acetylmuramyl-(pentapeptide) pyrophosphoryl-undecaprenol N-acetylglucosamine transferase